MGDHYYSLIPKLSNAAFDPNPLSETQPFCSTGNCTWPLFTSLGFCSKCQDISRHLQKQVTPVYLECDISPNYETEFQTTNNSNCKESTENYIYKFPKLNGQFLYPLTDGKDPSPDNRSIAIPIRYSSISSEHPYFLAVPLSSDWKRGFNFTDGTLMSISTLIGFIRLSSEQDSRLGDVLTADVCALSLCAQKRNVSVSFNRFSSSILQTLYGTLDNPNKYGEFETLSFLEDDFNMTYPSQTPDFDKDSVENALDRWTGILWDLMMNFGGKMGVDLDQTAYAGLYEGAPPSQATSDIVGAFNASSNISMTMENIATALTNYFRDSSEVTIAGQAGEIQIYTHVVWSWIILPAFLVLAGIVWLMLAMYETERQKARVWRTSEMALLFYGRKVLLDEELNAPPLHRVSEMEHAASKIQVKMTRQSHDEWMLHRDRED